MAVLTPQQRNILESAVKQARKVAEVGAFNALHGLAVDDPEPFTHMKPIQRGLRNSLRSKARLLGDVLPSTGAQEINHLTYELAYETWHKMLFAKFLEANNLLMHTDGVAVTLEDCEELARDENFVDKWDAAANYASKMLPVIFRTDDPLMQVVYSTDERIKLEEIIDGLESQIFTANDALGWVYQFWQSEAKAAINDSGDKIDGAKLPAVTQLFTEPYMVHFLIDNTLGAWWVSRNPGIKPPVKFEYLRLLEDGTPAAGKFEGWPDKTAEVTSLDPCMGSGHFVASLFTVFVSLRMYDEVLTKEEATDKVIFENLHGLEIDARCTQIAAFNLALTAWKFCGHYKELPEMNLACCGIAPKGKVADWVKLVEKVERADDKLRMENGMRVLYDHFQLAPELGSLLDPSNINADVFTASFDQLQPVLVRALEGEADKDLIERGVIASGIAKAGELLAKKYTLQITNVPYLGRGKLVEKGTISNYCLKHYPEAKGDLANVFLEKMLKSNSLEGISCTVMPHNWLFLTTFKKYRENFLKNQSWIFVVRLGEHAFENTEAAGAFACMVGISKKAPSKEHTFFGINVANNRGEKPIYASEKEELLKTNEIKRINQLKQLENPDTIISIVELKNESLLGNYAKVLAGIDTGDGNRFKFKFWELPIITSDWIFQLNSFEETKEFSGRGHILFWQGGKGELLKVPGARIQNLKFWNKKGIYIVRMAKAPATISFGEAWDRNGALIIPKKESDLLSIWEYSKSNEFRENIRKLNQKLSISEGTFPRINFDLEYWQNIVIEKYPNGLPRPFSDDPTQWLFHGNPLKSDNQLQVGLARLLGYRWPAESDSEMELADEAQSLIKAVKSFDHLTDEDGIFCIPSVNAEQAGADRLRSYLQEVFAREWNNQTITQLLAKEGSSSSNLEEWLRKEFFIQHCKVFQNRPFIWHIWDGRNDGFSALVNYHKLDNDNLSKLIYTYLGDWIRMCEAKKKSGESGAEGLLSAALKLKEKLEAILQGEAPYDIFVRWKPLEQQPIGWEPDLNDGVRLNIRPFIEADVLRKKPNIRWGIDRGKNPRGSYWGESRDNDKHLSLEEKRAARENSRGK
jgi:hypothetical protein